MLLRFIQDELGQDMVEYGLLLAFVVVCSAALLLSQGESIAAIWNVTNDNLSAAASAAG